MAFMSSNFLDFVSPDCDRLLFLQKELQKMNVSYTIVKIGELQHIFVHFPQSFYSPLFHTKTLLVHYDRAPLNNESKTKYNQGANDNSAAVYQTLHFIKRLTNGTVGPGLKNRPHNIKIVFTDGEELPGTSAGSFGLAKYFIQNGLVCQNDKGLVNDIYVLDGCGRGTVLGVSTAGKNQKASPRFARSFDQLYANCCTLAKNASPESWVRLPIPYGDNAGFIAHGVPAVMLSVLPQDEATKYLRQLQKDKSFATAVMNHEIVMHGGGLNPESIKKMRSLGEDPAKALLLSEKLPQTWRMMHTEFDTKEMLNKEAFELMERFLDVLAFNLVPA
ncbi:MAG TPA: M28 family peptidase [Treponemataceae bacterium]|nr:M28 family peptidase [Treponemataceae bacterium]